MIPAPDVSEREHLHAMREHSASWPNQCGWSSSAFEVLPPVNVYSRRHPKDLPYETGFKITSTRVRKLVRENLPGGPFSKPLWERISQRLLDHVERLWGGYVMYGARELGVDS